MIDYELEDIDIPETIYTCRETAVVNFIQELENFTYRSRPAIKAVTSILRNVEELQSLVGDRTVWEEYIEEMYLEAEIEFADILVTREDSNQLKYLLKYLKIVLFNDIRLLDVLTDFIASLPNQKAFIAWVDQKRTKDRQLNELRSLVEYLKNTKYKSSRSSRVIEKLTDLGIGEYISKSALRNDLFCGEVSETNLFRIISDANGILERANIELKMENRFVIRNKQGYGYAIFVEDEQ